MVKLTTIQLVCSRFHPTVCELYHCLVSTYPLKRFNFCIPRITNYYNYPLVTNNLYIISNLFLKMIVI